ncbi:hypothetical protein PMAYCL1PPCAC_20006, partial [Pristionchus mayeri]
FKIENIIGVGGFGIVFEVIHALDARRYAVKRIPVDPKEEKRMVVREVQAMAKFDHPGIVRYNNAWIEAPPPGWQLDENRAPITRSFSRMKSWFMQILSAVAYILEQGFLHRDLKRDFHSKYSSKTDVFALGLILIELFVVMTSEDRAKVLN